MSSRIVVTGAGGFIGSHLVAALKGLGYWVRGVDLKYPEFGPTQADEFLLADLREPNSAAAAVAGMDEVCALAADMGGMGYISTHHASILRNNALINLHTLEAARHAGVDRYLYTSSACVYPEYLQTETDTAGLRESDAYPAAPQDAYGWEKLLTERACTYYADEYGLDVRIVRFHNVYGPAGTYDGGREKAPAALCRKVALADDGGTVEIWGDGNQTRSFCYIDDCVEGIIRILRSGYSEPLNLGSDEMVSINQLAELIIELSGKRNLQLSHVEGPQGVRGRNSDNSRLREVLGWEPRTSLRDGLLPTYRWIEAQVGRGQRVAA
jgi:nucleoside-diphosphate-sugar epimerase